MGRTWLVRGTAFAVFAILVGAWGIGVAGLRDSGSSGEERPPASPESSVAPESDGSNARVKAPRIRKEPRAKDADDEPRKDADNEPATDAPDTQAPETNLPTPDSPAEPEEPSDSPPPSPPSDPPSEPSDECTELVEILDCVLNPVTAQP